MKEPSSDNRALAGRALRALAQAGFEVGAFSAFAALIFIAVVMFDRWVQPIPLLTFEVRMIAEYASPDPFRVDRIRIHYENVLPENAVVAVAEKMKNADGNSHQLITVDVVLNDLNGPLQWIQLSEYLWSSEKDYRAGRERVTAVQGPPVMFGMLLLHFMLIPWLFLRYRFLPSDSAPARPLFSCAMRRPRLIVKCLLGGLALGVLVSIVFILGISSGLLTFSSAMLSHESLGMTTVPLILLGAFVLALGGFLEEAFFRGVVLRRFVQNGIPIFGILVCAIWFAALHAFPLEMQSGDILFVVSTLGAGLGFGWMALKFNSWLPSGFVHAGYNFSVTFLSLLAV